MDLQKVAADSKRIAEKMQATQLLAEQSKLQNKSPSGSASGEKRNNDPENNRVLCGWREDEDDRFNVSDHIFTSYRQNPYCDQHPEKMKAIMKAFFMADHDAAQLEQYELENGSRQEFAIQKPAMTLKQALYRGLRTGLLLILILSGQLVSVNAQTELKALKVGDKVPDITIQNIINYSSTSAKISDFKGELLILDFWASWCGACLGTLPKADSLQKKFGKKLQFMPVTYQTRQDAVQYFGRLQKRAPFDLPSIVEDKTLSKLFPYQTIPHYVWINREGVVAAITGFEAVNSENIQAMMAGRELSLRVKKDVIIPYQGNKPLFVNNNGGSGENVLYRTMFTPFIDGIGSGISAGTDSNHVYRITARNQPIKNLFQLAFTDKGSFSPNFIDLQVSDPSKLTSQKVGMEYEDWMPANTFCYEIIVPPAMEKQALQNMREDLNRFIPQYSASVEKKTSKCLALVRTSAEDKIRSKGGKSATSFDAFGFSMINFPLKRLIDQLNVVYMQRTGIPVVNETGYTHWVDMVVSASLTDVNAMNAELARYDLKFIEKDLEVEKLVIRDRK